MPMRCRRRSAVTAGLALTALAVAAAPAAGAVTAELRNLNPGPGQSAIILGDGQANTVTLRPTIEVGSNNLFIDAGAAPVTAGPGCQANGDDAICTPTDVRAVTVVLGGGNDTLDVGNLNPFLARDVPRQLNIAGNEGDDDLRVSGTVGGANTGIAGNDGNDLLRGGPDRMRLIGGNGNDALAGGNSADELDGGPGADEITGRGGDDRLVYEDRTDPVELLVGDGQCNDGGVSDAQLAGSGLVVATGRARLPDELRDASMGVCANAKVDRDAVSATVETFQLGAASDNAVMPRDTVARSVFGNGGNDRIEGGLGADFLVGGSNDDTIFARDGIADARIACQDKNDTPGLNDRVLADVDDPVDEDCEIVERGGLGVTGPSGGGRTPPAIPVTPPFAGAPVVIPPPPPPPPELRPSPPSGVSGGATGGAGRGGGDNGRTPPQIQVLSPLLSADRRGSVPLRIRCVYRARECVGTVRITLRRGLSRGSGRRRVRLAAGATLATARVSIPWGRSKPVFTRISSRARQLIRPLRSGAGVTIKVEARDGAAPRTARVGRATRNVALSVRP